MSEVEAFNEGESVEAKFAANTIMHYVDYVDDALTMWIVAQ